jgi:hypothetical protein
MVGGGVARRDLLICDISGVGFPFNRTRISVDADSLIAPGRPPVAALPWHMMPRCVLLCIHSPLISLICSVPQGPDVQHFIAVCPFKAIDEDVLVRACTVGCIGYRPTLLRIISWSWNRFSRCNAPMIHGDSVAEFSNAIALCMSTTGAAPLVLHASQSSAE